MEVIKKGFWCLFPGYEWTEADAVECFYAETPSKARYKAFRCWDMERGELHKIRVRRAKERDLLAPEPLPVISDLTDRQQSIIAHSNGNDAGRDQAGYRNHYCCRANDADLLALVGEGLMEGPIRRGHLGEGQAYFFLNQLGKQAALSMLPRYRGQTV